MLAPLVALFLALGPNVHWADFVLALPGRSPEMTSRQNVWAAQHLRLSGKHARVRPLPLRHLFWELGQDLPVLAHFEAEGQGPELLRLEIAEAGASGRLELYRRMEAGWWMRQQQTPFREGGWMVFHISPGRYILRQEDKFSRARPDFSRLFTEQIPPSNAPEAKANWRFYRAGSAEARGPIPIVLIHGAGTDRWADFIHWARFSPEAGALRQAHQIWNFPHERWGVDAAVGYDPACPMFKESIVAYLDRFIRTASTSGVPDENGVLQYFPDGPFVLLTHSHGALKARAFLRNFPEYQDRVLAMITLGAPHTGTPLATVEWMQYTAGTFGLREPSFLTRVFDAAIRSQFLSIVAQSDLDVGWGNFDAVGGQGIPVRYFPVWSLEGGWQVRMLSPRDANLSMARLSPAYPMDVSFQPQLPLETFCGGLDLIQPEARGDAFTDRIYSYASYIEPGNEWIDTVLLSIAGAGPAGVRLSENVSLRLVGKILGMVETQGAAPPLGVYRLNDGFIPLQSQLFLDGRETGLLYATVERNGWRQVDRPLRPDWDLIRAHTLLDPEKIRLFPGWSHLETVTGRYNRFNGRSPLFRQIAADLETIREGA